MNGTQCATIPKTALYMRLSQEDDGAANQSQSIINQQKLLWTYAKDHGMIVVDEYADDGYTGTSFDRPEFLRMKGDIEQGKINVVITKDLSRLGRNYTESGYYQEVYFPEHQVRYIAILDGYDSDNEYSTMSAPWVNVAKNTHHSGKRISTKSPATDKSHSNRILPHSPKGMCCTTITA